MERALAVRRGRTRFSHPAVLVLAVLVASWVGLPRVAAQELSALPADARSFACTLGLPALASASPRRRVLVEGPTAADLALACSEAAGTQVLDVTAIDDSAWQRLHAQAVRAPSVHLVRLAESARARARARREALGPERYDLVVLAPVDSPGEDAPLSAALPRITSETVEGLSELIAALSSEGALFGLLAGEPAALRFALTAMEALRAQGVARPAARVLAQRSGDRYGVWVSPGPIAMDTLLQLHERDRKRRERRAPEAPRGEPRWATTLPALVHTPVAVFADRFATTLSRYGAAVPPAEPPAYAFDVGAVHDERPLFFELTRRDRPDTWTDRGPYVRSLELLGVTLVAWLVGGVLALRAMRRARAGGLRLGVLALLVGVLHGVTLCWTAQAASRALAEVRTGVLVTLAGFVVGFALAFLAASRAGAQRSALVAGVASFGLAALGPAAWFWHDAVGALVSTNAGTWWVAGVTTSAGAACALPAQLALRDCVRGDARSRVLALSVAGYAAALATSLVMTAVTVLFADFRALGLIAAATGVTAAVLAIPRARRADAGARA